MVCSCFVPGGIFSFSLLKLSISKKKKALKDSLGLDLGNILESIPYPENAESSCTTKKVGNRQRGHAFRYGL